MPSGNPTIRHLNNSFSESECPISQTMKYLSVCSGIESASVAWHPLGWEPVAFSEIEAFPCSVLAHHYPNVPNLGDLTRFAEWPEETLADADLLVGGTPCQAFSVAGTRNSLADARGNLTLTYVQLLDAIDAARTRNGRSPAICVWENVPGVLSTKDNAFGCFLAALAGEHVPLLPPGGRWTDVGYVRGPRRAVAWRVLDAQYFGLAQRRRRVFIVAGAGGFSPEEVLFEREGVRRDSPPRREAGERAAQIAAKGVGIGSHWDGVGFPHPTLNQSHNAGGIGASNQELFSQRGCGLVPDVAHALRGEGFDASEDGTGRGTPLVPAALRGHGNYGDGLPCLQANGGDCAGGSEALVPEWPAQVASTLNAAFGEKQGLEDQHVNGGRPLFVPLAFNARQDPDHWEDRTGPLDTNGSTQAVAFNLRGREGGAMPEVDRDGLASQRAASGGSSRSYVAFTQNQRDEVRTVKVAGALAAEPGMKQQTYLATPMAVRRLTPRECERLQGFPDDYTRIAYRGKPAEDCPDGPRYKALGNSKAVPVVRWIGRRIQSHLNLR